MKKLRIISSIALILLLLIGTRCSDTKTTPAPSLSKLTGTVTYPNTSGVATPAVGATVTLLTPASGVLVTLTDIAGKYTFLNLENGAYSLSSSFYAVPTNTGGRLDGLNFATESDAAVTMSSAELTKDLSLVNTGQSGSSVEAIAIDYQWSTGTSAYVNTGAYTFDGTHSPITFTFPYRGNEADFIGAFAQLSKLIVSVDPANPSAGTISAEVDMLSVNTRTAGGRDPVIQNGANETGTPNNYQFSPETIFSVMGCISGTFGIAADGALPSLIVNDNGDRYAQFNVVAGGISKYGDGYVAKGNLTWRGFTVPTEMWFKLVPKWLDTPSSGNGTTNNRIYSGFEAKFLMDPYNKFNIRSGSVNEAIIRINISVVAYHL